MTFEPMFNGLHKIISSTVTVVVSIIDRLVWFFFRIGVDPNLSLEEIQKRRYDNGEYANEGHKERYSSYTTATFAYELALNREDKIQTKLIGLTQLQGAIFALVAIFGLTKTSGLLYWAFVISLWLNAFSILIVLYSLSVTASVTPEFKEVQANPDGEEKPIDDTTLKQFQDAVCDVHCRSDFRADCLRLSLTSLTVSLLLILLSPMLNDFWVKSRPANFINGSPKETTIRPAPETPPTSQPHPLDGLNTKTPSQN